MDISEFREICGDGGKPYNYDTAERKLSAIEMEYTTGQPADGGWGTFAFYNNESDSIWRPGH